MSRHPVTGNACFGRSWVSDDGCLLLPVAVGAATGKTALEARDRVDKNLSGRYQNVYKILYYNEILVILYVNSRCILWTRLNILCKT